MKVLIWNMNRARHDRDTAWNLFKRENADLALLQEVVGMPPWVMHDYNWHPVTPRYFSGRGALFSTVVLSKWPLATKRFLVSEFAALNKIQFETRGWIVESEISDGNDQPLKVVSVHSPAFPIPRELLDEEVASAIQLPSNPNIWFTEVLCSMLKNSVGEDDAAWIVGGDFNSSILFDQPRDRGNAEIISRLCDLRFSDCLSRDGSPVPTFKQTRGGLVHQVDYCYVSETLRNRLKDVRTLDRDEVFDVKPRASDHLPILCEFTYQPSNTYGDSD